MTWILVAIAVLLGGFVYFREMQSKPPQEEVQVQQKPLFSFKEEDIKGLTLETPGKTLKFERTNDKNLPWRMKQPEDVPANDASVSFLLNLLIEGKSDRNVTITPEELKEYGLNKPLATIMIQLANQENHQIVLGKSDFKDEFIYAQIDPPSQGAKELTITLVPKEFQYAVERELVEWKQAAEKPLKNEEFKTKTPQETK